MGKKRQEAHEWVGESGTSEQCWRSGEVGKEARQVHELAGEPGSSEQRRRGGEVGKEEPGRSRVGHRRVTKTGIPGGP